MKVHQEYNEDSKTLSAYPHTELSLMMFSRDTTYVKSEVYTLSFDTLNDNMIKQSGQDCVLYQFYPPFFINTKTAEHLPCKPTPTRICFDGLTWPLERDKTPGFVSKVVFWIPA